MKLVIIDGQGGRLGSLLTEKIKAEPALSKHELLAIGTNSIATSEMLKAGADFGATGENPIAVACEDADFIIGPVGIVCANSLFGEVTERAAVSVGKSRAEKILIPVNKCKIRVAGISQSTLSSLADDAVRLLLSETKRLTENER